MFNPENSMSMWHNTAVGATAFSDNHRIVPSVIPSKCFSDSKVEEYADFGAACPVEELITTTQLTLSSKLIETETFFPCGSTKENLRLTNTNLLSSTYDALHHLPYAISSDLENTQLESGIFSSVLEFFENFVIRNIDYARKIIQDIFYDAIQQNRHRVAYNMMVILSELSYSLLGVWASIMAEAALKTPYDDIAEVGIRCFENWEDKEACKRLKNFNFKHDWLKEYAEEVCLYVENEGTEKTSFVNYEWQIPA